MKFTPKEIQGNVNISTTHPLKEFFILLFGILGALLVIYLILGLVLDILVDRMQLGLENKLGILFKQRFESSKSLTPAEKEMQRIIDDFLPYMPATKYQFRVYIINQDKVSNAVAVPGGLILVYSGLFKDIQTENELAMILAHELGHFAHRDHLRGLGRGLVLAAISIVTFGADSAITQFLMDILITTDLRFSRKQEAAADKFALELLNKKYGHVAGATDYFEHIKDKKTLPRFFKFFSTHPLYPERITMLNEEIKNKCYQIKEKIPLNPIFKTGDVSH